MGTTRSITFHRDYGQIIATTDTSTSEYPVQLVKPIPMESGTEELASLTTREWAELVAFVETYGGVPHLEHDGEPDGPTICGLSDNEGALCIVSASLIHRLHIGTLGKVWANTSHTKWAGPKGAEPA